MNTNSYYCYEDFARLARRRLPKFVFDFVEGGAGNEKALKENVAVFQNIQLKPRVATKKQSISLESEILGLHYRLPFGVAPLGLAGLINPKAEGILAKTAARYKAPYIYSVVSNTSLESVSQDSGVAPWFQLYIPKLDSMLDDLMGLAASGECPVMVLTVDTSRPGRRLRDLKNGLKLPFKLNVRNSFDVLQHPGWLTKRLASGRIRFPNFEKILSSSSSMSFSEIMSMQTGGALNWETIRYIRKHWKKKFILKGVLSERDALTAREIGVDAIIISNHGGRQLNMAPAPFSLIKRFRESGVEKQNIIVDSGIRTGEDIIASIASGASFTFLGRLFLFALAAKGQAGVESAFDILTEELNIATTLMGVESLSELDLSHIS